MVKTPIVLLIYHRPETTGHIIDTLRKVKPDQIFVVADGPKSKEDKIKCQETRDQINLIDWKCKIYKKYSRKNIGLRKNIVSGLDWVFRNVERAIILEDDLIMDISFFRYCDLLLEKYKNNNDIISISGNNFQFGTTKIANSYYFSRYVHSWGWATWKRAWNLYDDKMEEWPLLKDTEWLHDVLNNKILELYWTKMFDMTYEEFENSWSYRWTFSAFLHDKLTIIPKVNLVSNVGYDKIATHTIKKTKNMGIKTLPLNFPLSHPDKIVRNKEADRITENNIYLSPVVNLSLLFRSTLKTFFK